VPVPVIAASLFARFASRDDIQVLGQGRSGLCRNEFGGHAVRAAERAKSSQDPR